MNYYCCPNFFYPLIMLIKNSQTFQADQCLAKAFCHQFIMARHQHVKYVASLSMLPSSQTFKRMDLDKARKSGSLLRNQGGEKFAVSHSNS